MKKFVLIPMFSIIAILNINSQTDNTFWFAIPHATWQHTGGTAGGKITAGYPFFGGTPVYLRIASSGPTTVTVSLPAKSNYILATLINTAFKDTVFSVDLTTYMSASWRSPAIPRGNTGPFIDDSIGFKILNSGIKIVANGNPVTAYWDLNNSNNRDLMSFKGQNSLGNEFYIPMQNQWDEVNCTTCNGIAGDNTTLPVDATKYGFAKSLVDTARGGFDIIATADGTKITINPTADLNNGTLAGGTLNITLNTGQTYSVLIKNNRGAGHLGGTHVKVTNGDNDHPIAITDKDDSDIPLNSGYDYLSDQLVPVNVIGEHYIVTPGRLISTNAKDPGHGGVNLEWYYITVTQNNTTISVNNGGAISNYGPLNAGQQVGVQPPAYNSANPWSTVDASAPVYVYQVTGFVDEPGAALIPKIDGCTGSQTVFFVSPTGNDSIYLNILAYNNAIYNMYITWPGLATPVHLKSSDFIQVGATSWYIFKPTKNSFTYGPNKIPHNTACKMYTTSDRFHLGVIGGTGAGAKYGYFSDFAEDKGGATVRKGGEISQQIEACFGDTLVLVATGGFNYQWSATRFGDTTHLTNLYITDSKVSNPSIFPPPGQYNYYVHFSRPCWGDTTIKIQVSIDPVPVANFTVDNSYKCTPPTANPKVTFTNTSLGANYYKWSFNYPLVTPDTCTVLNHIYQADTITTPLQYTVFLLVSNSHYPGCNSTIQKTVTILPRIKSDFTDGTASVCDSVNINFNNQSKYNVADSLYRWDFGDQITSTLKNPSHIFRNLLAGHDTTYNVKLLAISPYNCRDSVTKTMTVHPYIKADFVIDSAKGCSDLLLHINNSSLGVSGAITNYNWNFGNGTKDSTATKKNYTKTYTDTLLAIKNFPINLTVSNAGGCKSSLSKQISVYPKITALFTQDSTKGCNPLIVNFANKSKGDTSFNMFRWNFGDGSSSSSISPQHVFTNTTNNSDITDTVKLIATSKSYCTSSVTSLVKVHPYLKADFTIDSAVGCADLPVNIINKSSGTISNYNWQFGNGDPIINTASKLNYFKTYHNDSTITLVSQVRLVVSNSAGACKDTLTRNITAYPKVHAGFAQDNFSGCNPDTVSFTPVNNKVAVQYAWTFGDGSSSNLQNPMHIFENTGNTDLPFPVKLVVTSNNFCRDTSPPSTVIVHERIEADFSVDTAVGCNGFKTNIYNASQGGTGIFSYLWHFGDGTADISHVKPDPQPSMFSHTFSNSGNNDTAYHFTLTVKNDNNCASTYMVPMLVHPKLSASFTETKTMGCPIFKSLFTNKSNKIAANQFKWDFGDGSNSMNTDTVSHYYSNTDSVDKSLTAKLVAISTSTGCSDTATVPIKVYSYVKANFSLDNGDVCTYEHVNLTFNGSGKIVKTYWDYYGTGKFDSIEFKNPVSKLFNNAGVNPVTYQVKLKVRNNQNCFDSITKPVIVYPYVNAKFTPSPKIICDSSGISFTNGSNAVATQWNWDFGDGTSSDVKVPPAHVYFHLNSADQTYTIKLHTVSNFSCVADTSINITVHSYIHPDFTVDSSTVCSNFGTTVTNNSSPGVKHNYWDFDGNGTTEVENNNHTFSQKFFNTGTVVKNINIGLVVSNNACFDTLRRKISVYPLVIAKFTTNPVLGKGCNPLPVTFSQANSVATHFVWDFGDGNGSFDKNPGHTFVNISSSDISFPVKLHATSDQLCSYDTSMTIKVYRYVKADFSVDSAKICSGFPVQITDNSPPGVTFRKWDFEGDHIFNPGDTLHGVFLYNYSNTTLNTVVYNLTMVVRNNNLCSDTAIKPITVYPKVVADYTATWAGCNPLPNTFKHTTNVPIQSYNWDFHDGSNSNLADPAKVFSNTTSTSADDSVTFTAISFNGCQATKTHHITVYPFVKADISVPNASICSGVWTEVQDTSRGGISKEFWYFSSASHLDSTSTIGPHHFYHKYTNITSGNALENLRLIVQNSYNCQDTVTRIITVFPKVTAQFTMDNSTVCSPYFDGFHNQTTPASVNDYNWSFGDGNTSSLKDPSNNYINYTDRDTVLKVQLIAKSDYLCVDSIEKTLYLNHKPRAEFSVDNTIDCPPFNVVIHNNSITSNAAFYWQFGDAGSTVTNNFSDVKHTYYNTSTNSFKSYMISLKALTNKGCFDTTSLPIKVYPNITAGFSMDSAGCNPFPVEFVNSSTYPAYYYWDFTDTVFSTQENPSHVFFNYGMSDRTFPVMLKALSFYGCKDSVVHNLVVHPAPDARFTSDKVFDYYPSSTFEFYDHTNKGPWIYNWNFGDNRGHSASKDSVSYTYQHWGNFKVKLNVGYGKCSDSAEQEIILQAPVPIALFDSSAAGCSPVTVYFNSDSSKYVNSYLWQFGDGTISEKKNPSHTFMLDKDSTLLYRDYNVILTVQGDGGTDFDQKMVRVYANPMVNFNIQPAQVMVPHAVIRCFNSTPGDGNQYNWYFGDGGESSVSDPVYKYVKSGTYNIKLVVTSINKCQDSATNFVIVRDSGRIDFPNAFLPNMSGPQGGAYNPAYPDNSIFFPYCEGVAEYHLEIFNRWGELLYISDDVTIGWDGYYKGKLCTQGVYVYKAKGKFYNGQSFMKAGDVTLLLKKRL